LDSLDEAVEGLAFPTSAVSNIGNSWWFTFKEIRMRV
jgi:hypothetical protein